MDWLVAGLASWIVLVACTGCGRQSESKSKQDDAPAAGRPILAVSQPIPVQSPPVRASGAASRPPAASGFSSEPNPAQPASVAALPPWLPLADAAAGEWAEYETREGQRLRYDVLTITSSSVTTRVTFRQAGRAWGEPATREDDPSVDLLAREADRHHAERRLGVEPVQAAGRTWQATLYEDRWIDEDVHYVRRTWVNSEVPYFGTLRMELYGDNQLEARLVLAGYGSPRKDR